MSKQRSVELGTTTQIRYRNICITAISNLANGWLQAPIRSKVSIASKPPPAHTRPFEKPSFTAVFLYCVAITMHTYAHIHKI